MTYRCDLCGGDAYRLRGTVGGKNIAECVRCSMVSIHPLPTPSELHDLYNDSSYFEIQYFQVDDAEAGTAHYRHFLEAADWARRHCAPPRKLLEIGPGQGMFLRLCRERGILCEAVEASRESAAAIRARVGCPVHEGILEEQGLEPQSFGMVVAFDVLEHALSPDRLLRAIHRVLEPDGILILSTVSIDNALDRIGRCLAACGIRKPLERLYPSYHLFYFTPSTLNRYLSSVGFASVRMTQENYTPAKASKRLLERLFLQGIYSIHDITGRKTNLYGIAKRKST